MVSSKRFVEGGRHWDKRGPSVRGGRALLLASSAPPTQQLPAGASSSCLCKVPLEGIVPRRGRFAGSTEDGPLRPPFLLPRSCSLLRLEASRVLGSGPCPAGRLCWASVGEGWGCRLPPQDGDCLCSDVLAPGSTPSPASWVTEVLNLYCHASFLEAASDV